MSDLNETARRVARSFIADMRDVSRMDVAEIVEDEELTDEQIHVVRQRVRDLADTLNTHVGVAP